MSRTIVFRDGVFFDDKWNAIDPTSEELSEIANTVSKYNNIYNDLEL